MNFFSLVKCLCATVFFWGYLTGTLFGGAENPVSENALEAARERNRVAELSSIESDRRKIYDEIAAQRLSGLESSRRLAPLASRFQNFLERFPDDASAHVLYAKFLRDGGENAEAEIHFKKALALQADWAVIYQQLAAIAAERGDVAGALFQMQKAVELEPGTAVYQMQLGELLVAFREQALVQKIFSDAAALDAVAQNAFRAARAIEPDRVEIALRYAESFYDVASPDWNSAFEAWNYAERIVEKSQRFGTNSAEKKFMRESIALHRARVFAELGKYAEAEAILRESSDLRLQRSREIVQKIISEKRNHE